MPLCHCVATPVEVVRLFADFDPTELHIFLTGDDTWESFSGLLRGSRRLTSLSVDGAPISDRAGFSFAFALAENVSLTSLDVTSPALTDRAGEAIARSLVTNSTLLSINVRADTMSDRAGAAFAKALVSNRRVASLSLFGGPRMGDTTGVRLAESLWTNRTLRSINLYGGAVGEATAEAFAAALEANATLTSFIARGTAPLGVQAGIARNRALPSQWRHLLLIVKHGEMHILRMVIAAMTEGGFQRAVFKFFLPPGFAFGHGVSGL